MDQTKDPNQNIVTQVPQPTGKIVGIEGQVIEVEFDPENLPSIREILILEKDPNR